MSTPTFTVVVTAFNEEELVGFAIRSVLAQTRADWRLIVVDDGSSDATADVVGRFVEADPRIQLIRKQNEGLSAARNTAIEASDSPYIAFLDADDMWLPQYLQAMAAALEADERAGIACTDAWALDVETGRFRKSTAMANSQPPTTLPSDPEAVMRLLIRENFIWVSTTVRRRALDDAGWFRPEFRVTEDLELWFRILACGYRVVRTPHEVLGIKRQRPSALSRQELTMVVNRQRVMRLVATNQRTPPSVRVLAEQRWDQLERWRRALSGESIGLALLLRSYRRLGALRRYFIDERRWRDEPPAEVRAAFPELKASD